VKPFSNHPVTQQFDVYGANWRFGTDDDGTSWVVAADVAKSFEHSNTSVMLRSLDDDEKGLRIVYTLGGQQELAVVLEDGLWELIFLSRKPGARRVKKRVKAILREIREIGRYDSGVGAAAAAGGTVPWEHAAAVARSHGLKVDAHGFKALLISGGVLTTRNGAPRRKWEYLFWPVPDSPRWEVRTVILPQLIYFAAQVRRNNALAEQTLQMSLPFPVIGSFRPQLDGDAA
jgi:prophage antirepressor-like protein